MKKEFINKKLLEEAILDLEKGYIDGVVNEVKLPYFISLCEKAINEADNDERKEALKEVIETHKKTIATNNESMESLELLIPKLKELC